MVKTNKSEIIGLSHYEICGVVGGSYSGYCECYCAHRNYESWRDWVYVGNIEHNNPGDNFVAACKRMGWNWGRWFCNG